MVGVPTDPSTGAAARQRRLTGARTTASVALVMSPSAVTVVRACSVRATTAPSAAPGVATAHLDLTVLLG